MENNKINEGALTKRIKTLVLQERYEEAMKELDEIDVSKIRNISILCLVGEVYMGLERYDEAERILLRVYEKNPNTRRILDLLTTLYIDKGEYSEAEYYYKEFIGVASRDLHRYILRYRLDKGKGERLSVLIDTLEKLKDYEYIEEWAYELATLYEASGETKKCIHECDEIVLWFGHGEYVDKAIALKCKLTGQPLPEISTVEQHRVEEEERAAHEKQMTEALGAEMGIEGFAGADYEGSIDLDLIQRALDGDTTPAAKKTGSEENLQAVSENAAGAEQTTSVAVEETVADMQLQDTDELSGNASVPEKAEDMSGSEHTETADIDSDNDSGNDANDKEEEVTEEKEKSHIAHLFSSLMFGKKEKEKHFDWTTLKIPREKEDKPDEIELAAAAITAAEGRGDDDLFEVSEAESEGNHSLEVSETMNTEGHPEAVPEEEIPSAESTEETDTAENAAAEADAVGVDDTEAENEAYEKTEKADDMGILTDGFSQEDADFFGKLMGEDLSADYVRNKKTEEVIIEDDDEDEIIEDGSENIEGDGSEDEDEAIENNGIEDGDEIIEDDGSEDEDETIEDESIDNQENRKQNTFDDLFGFAGSGREAELIDDDGDDDDDDEVIDEAQPGEVRDDDSDDDDEDEISDDIHASDTVLNIFGSVTEVDSIKNQLARTFTKFEDPALDNMDLLAPYDINFVVTGYDMSVKSQIAIGIAKALNTYGICDKNKLVRATAEDLNGREFAMIFEKLKGGCLVVEGAGDLDDKAAGIIADFVQQENQDVAIVLEGEEESIKTLFRKYPVLHSKFLNIIHIGKYNENELVQLADGYAKKKGYEISAPAAASLKTLLRERMQSGYSVEYEDIMAIIEEAIASLEKRNMKNLFMTVLDNKYEEAAMFMLQPEDFKNINIPD
ncbi:MAG: tetratricopeptide repeat protein [Coprococcus sp.]